LQNYETSEGELKPGKGEGFPQGGGGKRGFYAAGKRRRGLDHTKKRRKRPSRPEEKK